MRVIAINLKMNFLRAQKNKIGLVIGFLILPVVIFCVLNFWEGNREIGKIAVIGNNAELEAYLSDHNFSFKKMEEMPSLRDVMLRTYEGSIQKDGNGVEYYVNYGGNKTDLVLKSIIQRTYEQPEVLNSAFQTIFLYVFGLMFLQAILNMRLFIEDRQIGIFIRLQNCFSNRQQYMLSHLLYNVAMLFFPSVFSLILFGKILNHVFIEGIFKIATVTLVAAVFCSVMALLLCVLVKNNDSTIMVGNIVVVLTTLLSGTFGEITSGVLSVISAFMPQKLFVQWLNLTESDKYFVLNKEFVMIILFIIGIYLLSNFCFKGSWSNSLKALSEEENDE